MGLTTITLGDAPGTKARGWLSAWGAWYADIDLDGEHTLSGQVALEVAGLSLAGTVLSGGPGTGRSFYRVVGGKGGWGKELPAKSYANDAGVRLATVLQDAAQECGETIEGVSTSERLGPAYTRPAGPASRVLEQTKPQGWYVDLDGVTRIGRRPRVELGDTTAPRTSQVDRNLGKVQIAPESLAAIVPGVTVEGIEAVDVEFVASSEGIRATLWGERGGHASRALAAFAALLEQLDPNRAFRCPWEYRVVLLQGERLDLQPVRKSSGMPDLQRVTVRPGVAGAKTKLVPGARVVVSFIDADPARPFVCGFEDADGGAFAPDELELRASDELRLGGTGGDAVVRNTELFAAWFELIEGAVNGLAPGTFTPLNNYASTGAPSQKVKAT